MKTVHTIKEVRELVNQARSQGKRIGFVPTMGALHAGHGSLVEFSVKQCDYTVVSIFVNPTQFGPAEDLDKYPRTLQADQKLCENAGADLIFAPEAAEMYPQKQITWVEVQNLTEGLCGAARPGHFRGVTTVCAKLFNIVQADTAYFGQKDAQQAIVIKQMVKDLNLPLEICVCPIVREPDGLAMSSRNKYLSPEQRKQAICLFQSLELCKSLIFAGEKDPAVIKDKMKPVFENAGAELEYIGIVDTETLDMLPRIEQKTLIAVAAKVGSTRLIDNLIIDLKPQQ